MHLHFDPIGGAAGDMFIAALVHAFPEHHDGLIDTIRAAGVPDGIVLNLLEHADSAMTGLRFDVAEAQAQIHGDAPHDHAHEPHGFNAPHRASHSHRRWAEIRSQLLRSSLQEPVIRHALGIFALIAEAEAKIHGVSADAVMFHEVGAWDSIADVVGAAYLIDAIGASSVSCAPLPLGAGRVQTAHGLLPVPAPATALLLTGLPVFDDGRDGERVTPTGAAILRYLNPTAGPGSSVRKLVRSGTGFGTKRFAGISNVLRVLVFEPGEAAALTAPVAQIEFEVDDQTAEDLAVGLERLRATKGVLDVVQSPVFGKKGRMLAQIRVLAQPDAAADVVRACFRETTTIGLREQLVPRTVLARRFADACVDAREVPVKLVDRPGGASGKAEMDAVANAGDHAERQRLREAAVRQAMGSE